MARRSIGQEQFGFAGRERAASSIEALVSLIDWSQVAMLLDPLYSAAKGEPAWPPLAMFKALLRSGTFDTGGFRSTAYRIERLFFSVLFRIARNRGRTRGIYA
ncbi:hypothetical protein [Novosphingobium sp. CF614]|uniref:hypothetical protein n=1 Tax=Novosphingobium sp. CF614 TaxID=1884364 RepID=UPI000A650570|nr:hypothetical protein [Novosphingobium sp. CF614]